jgi:hypothetical protein
MPPQFCKFPGWAVPEEIPFTHLNEGGLTLKAVARQIFVAPWGRGVLLAAIGLVILT